MKSIAEGWWARADSNCRPLPCQGRGLQSLAESSAENTAVIRFRPSTELVRRGRSGSDLDRFGTVFPAGRTFYFSTRFEAWLPCV